MMILTMVMITGVHGQTLARADEESAENWDLHWKVSKSGLDFQMNFSFWIKLILQNYFPEPVKNHHSDHLHHIHQDSRHFNDLDH